MRKPRAATLLPAVAACCGVFVASEVRGVITASISSPTPNQVLSNVYQNGATDVVVTGTATATNPALEHWTLDYCSGAPPQCSFVGINTGYTPVSNGPLGTWKTVFWGTQGGVPGQLLGLANGPYTLRLQVWDTGGSMQTYTVAVTVANFTATESGLQFDRSAGQTVTYTSVVPANFNLTETLKIKNASAQFVRTLVNNVQRGPGSYPDTWDWRNDMGSLLPDGTYSYIATVTSGTYSMNWDLGGKYLLDSSSDLSIQNQTVQSDAFNNAPFTYTYNFYQGPPALPAQVWLIFGPSAPYPGSDACTTGNQYCVLAGVFQPSGAHTVRWAYVDGTGKFRGSASGSQPALRHFILYGTLASFPLNMVILYGGAPKVTNVTVTPPVFKFGASSQTVAFHLAMPTGDVTNQLTVSFRNQASGTILRTLTLSNRGDGDVTTTWNGRANSSMPVAPGFYTVTVTATGPRGDVAIGQILTTVQY